MYKIILASGSPRRKEIFSQVGLEFSVKVSSEEEIITKKKPEDIVMELALKKASSVTEHITKSSECEQYKGTDSMIIIGADTMVAIDGQVLGKPDSKEAAKEMLCKLQGREHQVYTGVAAIINNHNSNIMNKMVNFYEVSKVWVCAMSNEQIEEYIATGEPFDKAGGYGIQGKFAVHIDRIEGDYNNIVGFPISKLYHELLAVGINIL